MRDSGRCNSFFELHKYSISVMWSPTNSRYSSNFSCTKPTPSSIAYSSSTACNISSRFEISRLRILISSAVFSFKSYMSCRRIIPLKSEIKPATISFCLRRSLFLCTSPYETTTAITIVIQFTAVASQNLGLLFILNTKKHTNAIISAITTIKLGHLIFDLLL